MAERWRAPFASSEEVRRKMSGLARRSTAPELALRQALHRLGMRYYLHRRPLPGLRREADVVFPRAKVAVFVDGCFWHGCPEHGRREHRTNGWYWPEKIERNTRRDRDTNERLEREGWTALRIWEHQAPTEAAATIQAVLRSKAASSKPDRPPRTSWTKGGAANEA